MSTAKQRRAAAHARRMKALKKKGLAGLVPDMKTNQIMDVLKKGGLIAVGVIAGRELDHKVFKPEEKEGFKKWIGTLAKAGGGVMLATQKNEMIKYIGAGLAAEAVVDAAGKVMKKDILGEGILSGLEGWDISGFLSGDSIDTFEELPPLDVAPHQIASPDGIGDLGDPDDYDRQVEEDYDEEIML